MKQSAVFNSRIILESRSVSIRIGNPFAPFNCRLSLLTGRYWVSKYPAHGENPSVVGVLARQFRCVSELVSKLAGPSRQEAGQNGPGRSHKRPTCPPDMKRLELGELARDRSTLTNRLDPQFGDRQPLLNQHPRPNARVRRSSRRDLSHKPQPTTPPPLMPRSSDRVRGRAGSSPRPGPHLTIVICRCYRVGQSPQSLRWLGKSPSSVAGS